MRNVGKFLSEVKSELSKVVWPTRQEFIGSTIIALILICAFAIYLGAIDLFFSWGAKNLFVEFGL